jgi:hypothetical protein
MGLLAYFRALLLKEVEGLRYDQGVSLDCRGLRMGMRTLGWSVSGCRLLLHVLVQDLMSTMSLGIAI